MPKKNIVVAGGGFAGISVLKRLRRYSKLLESRFRLVLIDKRPHFEFLPMLPDVIGGWMKPELLRYELAPFAEREKIEFINEPVEAVDTGNKRIRTRAGEIPYEYAVLATGSQTNFYGNSPLRESCLKLDDVEDALSINRILTERSSRMDEVNILVIGGGYTGIEIATNINYLLSAGSGKYHIYIVEKADDILKMLSDWMSEKVKKQLDKLGIEIITSDSLEEYDGEVAVLGSGRKFTSATCIWTAGVKTGEYLEKAHLDKKRTRIVVGNDLTPVGHHGKDLFIAGDTASFTAKDKDKPIRMAVMFSMGQGKTAANNIVRSIQNRSLERYKVLDLGFLVPMAHGKAPGVVMGARVWGLLGYMMHYFMCTYRSEWENKAGIAKDVMCKPLKRRKK